MENIQGKEMHYPRIYTIHSQKGGVGKTSIAIAIAGFAAIFHNKKALIIDADLTGTSLFDVRGWGGDGDPEYFNELLLARPPDFARYTSPISGKSDRETPCEITKFYRRVPDCPKIYYMPASPCFDDILKIIPLISQEDFLHFFRYRLEDIVVTAWRDHFDVIIIDNPPGLFGISTASLRMVLDNEFNHRDVRANGVATQAILLTTPDPTDYRALLPSFSKILEGEEESSRFKQLSGKIDMILNKVSSSQGRFDSVFEYGKILDDVKKFPDNRSVDPRLIDILRERAKKIGALACGFIKNFDIAEIVPTIQSLKDESGKKYSGMQGWCTEIGKGVGLWKDEAKK